MRSLVSEVIRMNRTRAMLRSCASGVLLAVLTVGCATTYSPPVVFQPTPTATAREFFSNGLPIAVVQGDSCAMLLAAEPTVVADQQYLRVWWLYANEAQAPVLIEPLANVSVMSRDRESGIEQRAVPEPPSHILHRIESEEAAASIALAIGGALKAAAASVGDATNPATVTGPLGTATIRDPARARAQANAELEKADAEAAQTRLAYRLYAESINNGVLRRNTVLPGSGVHGYVYVPWVGRRDDRPLKPVWAWSRPADTEHTVVIRVGAYSDSVLFTPGAGE